MRATKTLLAGLALALTVGAAPALAATHAEHPREPRGGFSFEGPFGKFDQAQLQRGYKVYKEVCSNCHSMHLMSFRDLGLRGGPFWYARYPNPNENPYVKAIAAEFEVDDLDTESGDTIKRKATPADRFPSPYANPIAAAAGNGGAVPPDLSVMAKARHGGARYIYSLLTGYRTPPAGLRMNENQHYNPWFNGDLTSAWSGDHHHVPHGGFIAMPPPLTSEGQVTFDDGTKPTVDQMATDVAAFIAWASEPKQTERKSMGVAVMIYLLLFAGLTFVSYRRVWKDAH
jgi:ubiquinol-cytochrome c reductase cytochrome c1 subunit